MPVRDLDRPPICLCVNKLLRLYEASLRYGYGKRQTASTPPVRAGFVVMRYLIIYLSIY